MNHAIDITSTGRYAEYDNWAWLYDQTVGPDYSKPQQQLLQRVLLPELKPGAHLLDLCCGTGQLIRPLLDAGYQVTGLDGSDAMIDCARRNAPGADYVLDDARTFDLPNTFDGAFSTSASLNHIDSVSELTQVFARVHAALHPGAIFVFDLNHPAQLERWWRGTPTEGEVRNTFAWMITPRYDARTRKGAFRVTIYQAEHNQNASLFRPLKSTLYRLLSKPRFIGLRLALLQRFQKIESRWQRQDTDYPITGHDLEQVRNALQTAGFGDIRIETIDGASTVDANHSAHFICRKESA